MSDPYFSVLVTVRPDLVNVYINGLPVTEMKEGQIEFQTKRKDRENMLIELEAGKIAIEHAINALN